jgi:peptidoglycan hydrolase FlgJ
MASAALLPPPASVDLKGGISWPVGQGGAAAVASGSDTTTIDAARSAVRAKTRTTATDFEASFLSVMFGQMMTDIGGEGPFGGSGAAGVWRSFLSDEHAKAFARAGGIGLADHVYRALLAQQEARAT